MKLVLPEELIDKTPAKIVWHHGTCDMCGKRNTLICHFGYNTQLKKSYKICKTCLKENIKTILFGENNFKEN